MPVCLLAPVPGLHLSTAANRPVFDGRAVFGSNLIDFFDGVDREIGLEDLAVLIWASAAGGAEGFVPGPFVSWRARFRSWE